MEDQPPVPIWDMVRMIATARILMPATMVRLSAGRTDMSIAEQALCFMAGANSIFAGEKLLTTPNPLYNQDMEMFKILGLNTKKAFVDKLKKENLNFYNFIPTPGKLVLFESWLRHEVNQNTHSKPRISVSFNYDWI